jgi:hypothetical protein
VKSLPHKSEVLNARLADRFGVTYHVSPVLMYVRGLMSKYPSGAECPTGWLLDVGNVRGARIVNRVGKVDSLSVPPDESEFSNEKLIAALCQLGLREELQSLRVAAQLISAGRVDRARLRNLIVRERLQPVLGALACQALIVEPDHPEWSWIRNCCPAHASHSPLLHWSRLAEPVPDKRHVASGKWRLVA